ncbi:MAG: lysostaphin resistance A-like protein [Bacteroidota bacterium]|jgi:membrane protease YdiL (CAAX protease family)
MSLLFMLIIVAGLPLLAAISYRNIKTLEKEEGDLHLAKAPIYFQSMLMQGGICLLAYYTGIKEQLSISLQSEWNLFSILSGFIFLVIALGFAYVGQRKQKPEGTLRYLLPETNNDRILWVLAVVVAAFCEEYIYRGVLYQLLSLQTEGNVWAAIMLSAIVFGFGHGTQGEKAIIQIIPFAIGFHLLVVISHGLLLPMIVHFIYNISVDLLFGKQITGQKQDP